MSADMSLDPETVDVVLRHMNDEHAADSLVIVQAHGAARAAPGTTSPEP